MPPRRRKAPPAAPWYQPRPGFVLALVSAPAVWWGVVNAGVSAVERFSGMEREITALRRDITRIEQELHDHRTARRR